PQNNFQKPSRTHWVCHGLLKIIFRLSSYVNFLTPITVFRSKNFCSFCRRPYLAVAYNPLPSLNSLS
ncbi:MAG: hypothetical protein ACH346_05710, partial [Chthoniobacterales bacterium]